MKRESKLSDYEVLISRLVDRAIRPLFPDDYHADTQVMIYLISGDEKALPDALAAFAASAAFSVSDIPFQWPNFRSTCCQSGWQVYRQSYTRSKNKEPTST